jgi:hypothetical protein
MRSKPDPLIPLLPRNGKHTVAIFHRKTTISVRTENGDWHRHLADVPPSIVNHLSKPVCIRLWIRAFQIERAWVEPPPN